MVERAKMLQELHGPESGRVYEARPLPCPVCDVLEVPAAAGGTCEMPAMTALAYGVALGAAFGEPHGVTERVCEKHRTRWVMAMMNAAIAANTDPR